MTPFEEAQRFVEDLSSAFALHQALSKIEEIKSEVGEDSIEFKITQELLLATVIALAGDEVIEA